MRKNSSADSTIPSGVSPYLLSILSDKDPWFVPILIAVPYFLQILTNGVNFSFILSNSSK